MIPATSKEFRGSNAPTRYLSGLSTKAVSFWGAEDWEEGDDTSRFFAFHGNKLGHISYVMAPTHTWNKVELNPEAQGDIG